MPVMSPVPYRFSGRLGRAGVVVPLAVLAAAPILAVAYSYANVYSFLVYLQFLALILFVVGMTLIITATGRWAGCRNPTFMIAMGALAGLIGLYVAWAAFEVALWNKSAEPTDPRLRLFTLLLHPQAIWELAKLINEDGWFSFHGTTPKGVALWLLWAGEAAGIVGCTAFYAGKWLKSAVYCEDCGGWCVEKSGHLHLAPTADRRTLDLVGSGMVQPLEGLQRVPAATNPVMRIDLWTCPRCQTTNAFVARHVERVRSKKGKVEVKIRDPTRIMLLDAHSYTRLLNMAAPPAEEPQPSQPEGVIS